MNAANLGADVATKVANSSNYEMVREGALRAVNWLGRQVSTISSSVKDLVVKIIAWAKPFFVCLQKFVCETFDKSKEFLIANRQVALPGAIIALVAVIAALSIDKIACSGEQRAAPTPA